MVIVHLLLLYPESCGRSHQSNLICISPKKAKLSISIDNSDLEQHRIAVNVVTKGSEGSYDSIPAVREYGESGPEAAATK